MFAATRPVGLLLTAVAAAAVALPAAEPDRDEFASVAARARRLAKNAKATPAARAAMLEELAGHDTPESALLIAAVGFAAADPATRTAARAAVVERLADPAVKARLLADWRRQSARPTAGMADLALALVVAEAPAGRGEFRELIDTLPRGPLLAWMAAICDAAVRSGDAAAVPAVRSLATLRCFSTSLACRRGVIGTLARMRGPEAIAALLDIFEGLEGEARGDVVRHLVAVSGAQHGTDVGAWRSWFAAHGGPAGPVPAAAPPPPPPAGRDSSQADYYDIPIYADRVVFVLDTSASMEGPRLETAKRELMSAIFALPPETAFTVVFFNSGVGPWRKVLVPASDANKRQAMAFVEGLPAEGRTATSDALEAAFSFDAEAIFLLSDGEPTVGRVVEPAGIVALVTALNRGRAVTVNTIGIMTGPGFLERLAQANHGTFRGVDE